MTKAHAGSTAALCPRTRRGHKAHVSVFDHGLPYGDGVFEGIRFYRGKAFRLDAHLARLERSAAAIRLVLPGDRDALAKAAIATIAAYGKGVRAYRNPPAVPSGTP